MTGALGRAVAADLSPYCIVNGSAAQGAAYVFTRNNGVWTQLQKLTANDGAVADYFGYAVAMDGDIVGAAGSVSTGAIDYLHEIAGICREEDLWFHVDGAFGGFAAMLPDAPSDLRGLSEADSVAVDPHKWLYAPLEAGCALVRDAEKMRAAFSYHPPYYHFGVEAINYFDLGPQNSRGFRALKVWLALQHVGRKGYEQMLTDDIRLAKELHHLIAKQPELEAFTQSLSITTFRYVPPDLKAGSERIQKYLNRLNTELLTRLQNSGEVDMMIRPEELKGIALKRLKRC